MWDYVLEPSKLFVDSPIYSHCVCVCSCICVCVCLFISLFMQKFQSWWLTTKVMENEVVKQK